MAGLNDAPLIRSLAVPSVCVLISFLAYFPQLLLHLSTLDPGPPSRSEITTFNILVLLVWYTYFKSVTVDPGRYVFREQVIEAENGRKWCRKCEAPKPSRAHHCRLCGRCVPRMDHHCPWTANCVSMTTFPHFLRFLLYANLGLWHLGRLLWRPVSALWDARRLPAYLGPTMPALAALAFVGMIWLVATLALGIMLVTTVRGWLFNMTMIEGWELERHEAALDRSGRDWWDISGPEGAKLRVERTEFPYDVGVFANMAQAMGTRNVLLWFFPLAGNPKVNADTYTGTGWVWSENGFNRREGMWPPLDPDKVRQARREWPASRRDFAAELQEMNSRGDDPEDVKRAFKQRQARDVKRKKLLMEELEEVYDDYPEHTDDDSHADNNELGGENGHAAGWTNSDGDRLHDFGVDEDAEDLSDGVNKDEDLPLGELLRRRNVTRKEPGAVHLHDGI